MTDPETPSGRTPPRALRLASASLPGAANAEAPVPEDPLATIVEALEVFAAGRASMAEMLRQRLGDARTLELLARGDAARGAGALLAQAAGDAIEGVRRSLAERPDDVAGRLACVRAGMRFGQVLLAQGLVAPRRLEVALESQKSSGRRIGEELVAGGHISAREVAETLWLQHKLAAAGLALLLLARRETSAARLMRSGR